MFRKLNPSGSQPREISEVVNGLMEGKSNNTGSFTTTASVTTTTLNNERIGYDSVIIFTPMSANAATELPTLYIQSLNKGYAVISHGNRAYTSAFKYVVIG